MYSGRPIWRVGANCLLHRYDGQIYFHWYKILGLLYKRALFDLQFAHNLFWLKLKWNARSKLFICIIYRSSIWSSRTLTKLKSQSQKRFNERKYLYLKYKNKNHSGTNTQKLSISICAKFKLVFCAKYDRLDLI